MELTLVSSALPRPQQQSRKNDEAHTKYSTIDDLYPLVGSIVRE
jgi:hypothetical protein